MPRSIEVYLPCEVFPVQVRFGRSDTLSTLETLLLRAIHLGEHHIEQLAKMFGLRERMLRDALMGLWHAGHVVFTSGVRKVYISTRAAEKIDAGKIEELERAPSGFQEMNLMFDVVTGRVLPLGGRTTPPNAAAVIPYTPNTIKLEHLPYDGIVNALQAMQGSELDRSVRVLNASIAFNRSQGQSLMRWRMVEVACLRTNEGQHEVTVLDTGGLPYGARRDIGQYLTRLVDEEHEGADKHFFDRLQNNAMQGRPDPFDIGSEINRLADAARNLGTCSPDEAVERHKLLSDHAADVALAVAEEISSVAKFTPVIGIEAHEKVINDLIKRTKEQVVIACPFVSGDSLARLRTPFKEAIGNGARIIILWGISRRPSEPDKEPYDMLPQEVKNFVEDFRTRYPQRFFFSQRATGTHAKVVVCDNAVLVTSLNVLSQPRDGVTDIGMLAQLPDDHEEGATLAVAADVLTWAREVVPDTVVANAISVGQKRLLDVPEIPPPPPVAREDQDAEQRRSAVAVWASQWVVYVEHLHRLRGVSPTATLVRDGEHRRLLERGFSSAVRRLIVTSDQISADAVRASTRESLRKLGEKGVAIRLVYRIPSRMSSVEGATAEQLLLEMEKGANAAGADLQCIKTSNHAKVLISDDIAVVSSFNFLSHAGQYGSDRGSRVSELGLQLSGPGIADEVATALMRAFPTMRKVSMTVPGVAPSPPDRDLAISNVLSALESERSGELVKAFVSATEPWRQLEDIAGLPTLGEDSGIVRRLAAACMAANGRDSDPVKYDRWARFLARSAWSRGDAVEAYVILTSIPENGREDETLPHILVIETTAKQRIGCADYSSSIPELDKIPSGQLTALAILAIGEAIERGSKYAADFAYLLSDYLPETWKRALNSVLEYLVVAFEPFPHDLLTGDVVPRQQEHKLEKAFKRLQKVLEHHSRKAGMAVWTLLFQESGLFGKLLVAARDRDAAYLHTWFDSLESHNAVDILRAAIHAALGADAASIGGDKRQSMENSIKNIMEAVVSLERISARTRYDRTEQLTAAAQRLAGELKLLWPALSEEAARAVDKVARPATDGIVLYLEEITRYATQ